MDTYRIDRMMAASDNGEVVVSGLFEAGSDAAEVLKFPETTLHPMALGVEVLVERIFERTRRVVGDDGDGLSAAIAWRKRSAS